MIKHILDHRIIRAGETVGHYDLESVRMRDGRTHVFLHAGHRDDLHFISALVDGAERMNGIRSEGVRLGNYA